MQLKIIFQTFVIYEAAAVYNKPIYLLKTIKKQKL